MDNANSSAGNYGSQDRKQPVDVFELKQQKDSTVCYWMILASVESAHHVEKGTIGDYGRADQSGCFSPQHYLRIGRTPSLLLFANFAHLDQRRRQQLYVLRSTFLYRSLTNLYSCTSERVHRMMSILRMQSLVRYICTGCEKHSPIESLSTQDELHKSYCEYCGDRDGVDSGKGEESDNEDGGASL